MTITCSLVSAIWRSCRPYCGKSVYRLKETLRFLVISLLCRVEHHSGLSCNLLLSPPINLFQTRNYCTQFWRVILKLCRGNVGLLLFCSLIWIQRSQLCKILIVCVKSLHSLSYWPFCGLSLSNKAECSVCYAEGTKCVKLYSWPVMVVIISSLRLAVRGPCDKMCHHHTCISQLGFHMLRRLNTIECKLEAFLCFKFFIILILLSLPQ